MATIEGWYYLHENKQLIFKPDPDAIADIRDSDFCLAAWPWINSRQQAWNILVQALSLGADKQRIDEMTKTWGCNDTDAVFYAGAVGAVLGTDGNQKMAHRKDFVNLQDSVAGFGDNYLEALADLCNKLGYKADKLQWGADFESLLK